MKANPSRVGQEVKRALIFAVPQLQPTRMALCQPTGLVVAEYECERSFLRVERDGRWWRLAGRDRATAEMVYLPDEAVE